MVLGKCFRLSIHAQKSGLSADIALPGFEQIDQYSLDTALGNKLKLTPLKRAMEDTQKYQCVLLNNDLSSGMPEFLQTTSLKVLLTLSWLALPIKRSF